MKITAVESIPVDRYLFAKVHTDAGLTGVGESGAWGFLEASQAAIDKLGRYLVGEDPLRIEHHWQYMYRFSHFRGAAIMGAISALDIALWDIAGKHFGAPVYQLMGGKTRDKARVYCHVFGDTRDKLVQGVKDARDAGFTAVGHLTPFLDEPVDKPFFKTHAENMRGAIEAVAAYREAAGDNVDLCIEIHRRLTLAEAVTLAKGIEPYHPLFYERANATNLARFPWVDKGSLRLTLDRDWPPTPPTPRDTLNKPGVLWHSTMPQGRQKCLG